MATETRAGQRALYLDDTTTTLTGPFILTSAHFSNTTGSPALVTLTHVDGAVTDDLLSLVLPASGNVDVQFPETLSIAGVKGGAGLNSSITAKLYVV